MKNIQKLIFTSYYQFYQHHLYLVIKVAYMMVNTAKKADLNDDNFCDASAYDYYVL